jgi:hypothetical protein
LKSFFPEIAIGKSMGSLRFGVRSSRPHAALFVRALSHAWRIEKNGLPAHKVGKLGKFKKDEVDEWIRSGQGGEGRREGA